MILFMRINNLRSKPASIPKTRWASYAAAGVATALAGSQSVDAAIHYSGVLDVRFPADRDRIKAFPLDQPGDSLSFEHTVVCGGAFFSINGIGSAAFRGYFGNFPYVSALAFGRNISTGEFVTHKFLNGVMAVDHTCLTHVGPWGNRGTGYVGFRFNNGAGIQYGWARVTTSGESGNNAFRVEAYAYADPGEPITAGQRPFDEQAPDKGSLGWLALGAVGLLAWRKSRSRTESYPRPSLPV
jgi:hypothetical protein